MPHRFCAICGKDIDKTAPHYGMCLECYSKEHPLFEFPEKFSLQICIDCGSFIIKEEWIKPQEKEIFSIVKEAVKKYLLKSYSKEDKINFTISFDEGSFVYSSKDLLISMNLMIEGILKENSAIKCQQIIRINLGYDLCKNCTNIRGGTYFLSIIQLRVKDESQFDLIKDALDEIHNYVEKLYEQDAKHYITKIEDQKYGVDLYLSTNELMKYIIKMLNARYHFLIKRSKKLVGRDSQKGKNLYRLKTLIKFLPINKNDVIIIEDQEYYIEKISKTKVVLRNTQGTKLIKEYSYFFNEKTIIKKSQRINSWEKR
ncbi:MAG: hypothetical protein EU532_05140 [Promethearchaeota archaeon]|nr:MAG: hypothetical protein EU532_05140 [Candidatus Lokiarchaeota archaeon]